MLAEKSKLSRFDICLLGRWHLAKAGFFACSYQDRFFRSGLAADRLYQRASLQLDVGSRRETLHTRPAFLDGVASLDYHRAVVRNEQSAGGVYRRRTLLARLGHVGRREPAFHCDAR